MHGDTEVLTYVIARIYSRSGAAAQRVVNGSLANAFPTASPEVRQAEYQPGTNDGHERCGIQREEQHSRLTVRCAHVRADVRLEKPEPESRRCSHGTCGLDHKRDQTYVGRAIHRYPPPNSPAPTDGRQMRRANGERGAVVSSGTQLEGSLRCTRASREQQTADEQRHRQPNERHIIGHTVFDSFADRVQLEHLVLDGAVIEIECAHT
jgi:hypothetical protein